MSRKYIHKPTAPKFGVDVSFLCLAALSGVSLSPGVDLPGVGAGVRASVTVPLSALLRHRRGQSFFTSHLGPRNTLEIIHRPRVNLNFITSRRTLPLTPKSPPPSHYIQHLSCHNPWFWPSTWVNFSIAEPDYWENLVTLQIC